jgi:hypothetical protein
LVFSTGAVRTTVTSTTGPISNGTGADASGGVSGGPTRRTAAITFDGGAINISSK